MTLASYTFLFYSNIHIREGIGRVSKRCDYILLVNHNDLGKLILKMYNPRLFAVDFD